MREPVFLRQAGKLRDGVGKVPKLGKGVLAQVFDVRNVRGPFLLQD